MRQGLVVCLAAILWLHTPSILSAQITGVWIPTGSMNIGRTGHRATVLSDSRVLVTGGAHDQTYQSGAEMYMPNSGHWISAGFMTHPRYLHTATLLTNGDVLVVGGIGRGETNASCEIFDASNGTWRTTGVLLDPRYNHTAIALPHRQVMVAGGNNGSKILRSVEMYDEGSTEWATAQPMHQERSAHTATLLRNGLVLVTGGDRWIGDSIAVTSSCELFDPETGMWRRTSSMHEGRSSHAAVLLGDGRVMVIGGSAGRLGELHSCEIFDPRTETWSRAGDMSKCRAGMAAITLGGGSVLVVGGYNTVSGRSYLALSEIYDPRADTWRTAPPISSPATTPTLSPLGDGRVLVAGGFNMKEYPQYEYRNDCELFSSPRELLSVEGASTGDAFSLSEPLPNPASSTCTMDCVLPTAGRLRIALYDALGRPVRTLVDAHRNAGTYSVVMDTDGLSSGTYYLHAASGTESRTSLLVVQH